MTILDGLLILLGLTVVILCTMEGLLRTVILLVSFYLITTATGLFTLATEMFRGIAVSLANVTGGSVPNLIMTQTVVFTILTLPVFVGFYFISKAAFPETALPKLHALDNVLGAFVGIALALLIMALIYNTWGVAVSVRWQDTQTWYSMRNAYAGAFLRPYMRETLAIFRPWYFMFSMLEYPPFFNLQA